MAGINENEDAQSYVRTEAQFLAKQYEVEEERVYRILGQTLTDLNGQPLKEWPEDKHPEYSNLTLGPPVRFLPSLREALRYLKPQKAFTLFESMDLALLGLREFWSSYISLKEAPLYTIEECSAAIERLHVHQQMNREALIKTGLPNTMFDRTPLLTRQMDELYPVKQPSRVNIEAGNYVYTWGFDDGREESYEEAPISPDLFEDEDDAYYLDSLRGDLYDARVEILIAMARCVRGNDPEGLWKGTLDTLNGCLNYGDKVCLYMLDIDSLFSAEKPITPLNGNGAFSALIGLAGHLMQELTVGVNARVRKELGELIAVDEHGRPYLIYSSYYEAVGKPDQEKLDKAYDMLSNLEPEEKRFWQEFEVRVDQELFSVDEVEAHGGHFLKPGRAYHSIPPEFAGYVSHYEQPREVQGVLPLLTAEEVAQLMKVHPKTVYLKARKGELPHRRIGDTVRFVWPEVDKALREEAERKVEKRRKDRGR